MPRRKISPLSRSAAAGGRGGWEGGKREMKSWLMLCRQSSGKRGKVILWFFLPIWDREEGGK